MKEPIEFTLKKNKLFVLVYQMTKSGQPLSYTRVYTKAWEQMNLIMDTVESFYQRNSDEKLHLKRISEFCDLSANRVSQLVLRMAATKKVIYQEGGEWKIEREKPMIVLQQRPKHILRQYWGLKTPVYALPFNEKYFKGDKETKL